MPNINHSPIEVTGHQPQNQSMPNRPWEKSTEIRIAKHKSRAKRMSSALQSKERTRQEHNLLIFILKITVGGCRCSINSVISSFLESSFSREDMFCCHLKKTAVRIIISSTLTTLYCYWLLYIVHIHSMCIELPSCTNDNSGIWKKIHNILKTLQYCNSIKSV